MAFGFYKPTPRGALVYAFNMGAVLNLHTQVLSSVFSHLMGQSTEIHVRACFYDGRSHLFMARTPFHQIGDPALDFVEIL